MLHCAHQLIVKKGKAFNWLIKGWTWRFDTQLTKTMQQLWNVIKCVSVPERGRVMSPIIKKSHQIRLLSTQHWLLWYFIMTCNFPGGKSHTHQNDKVLFLCDNICKTHCTDCLICFTSEMERGRRWSNCLTLYQEVMLAIFIKPNQVHGTGRDKNTVIFLPRGFMVQIGLDRIHW